MGNENCFEELRGLRNSGGGGGDTEKYIQGKQKLVIHEIGQSRTQSFSSSLSAVGCLDELWDNGTFYPTKLWY